MRSRFTSLELHRALLYSNKQDRRPNACVLLCCRQHCSHIAFGGATLVPLLQRRALSWCQTRGSIVPPWRSMVDAI